MRILRRIAIAIVVLLAAAYTGDYFAVRTRLPNSLATVTIQPYYAVPQRNGKEEIMLLDPRDEICVQSMFPHMGHAPCWYVRRHTQQRIQL